jgi:UPF0755 protein
MAKKKSKSSSIKLILISILGLGVLSSLLFGYHYYSYIRLGNVDLPKESTVFFIPTGSDFTQVSNELKKQNIIHNQESFNWVAEKKNYPNKIKSGKYTIQNGWSNEELINHLRSGNQTPVKITFHNISRLTQLASIVSKQIEADSTELIQAFLSSQWMKENGLNKKTVQSIFIPNTYELYWNTDGSQFVHRMHQEYLHFWSIDKKKKAKDLGLTPVEISTLASIVEAETKKSDEMPKVAGLYLNRLTIGMRLQSDPTVVFAINKPNVHRVYYADLKINSPYNTYIHTGLPPGPIGFPSTKALNAVLDRDQNSYIYMCAKPDYSGYHNFAKSFSQHQKNATKYRAFLKREGIR